MIQTDGNLQPMQNAIANNSRTEKEIVRHERYYCEEGLCYLVVEDTIFCLPKPLFIYSQCTKFFEFIFSLPRNKGREGIDSTESSPLFLEGINLTEFEDFLTYLFRERDNVDLPLEYLISILKLSNLWGFEVGRKNAIHFLSDHANLSLCLKIQLARKYDVHEWIVPTFSDLVDNNIANLSLKDIDIMGVDVYHALVRASNRIHTQKLYIAQLCPAALKADSCKHHDRCELDWKAKWWKGFCKLMLHPHRPISPNSALLRLEGSAFKYMSQDCLIETIAYIKRSSILNFRQRIIVDTIKELLEVQNAGRTDSVVEPTQSDEQNGESESTSGSGSDSEAMDI